MSGATEALSRKIAGAHDLKGVVRSMKALAASSIEQYERAVESLDGYYRTVELGLSVCLRQSAHTAAPPVRRRPPPAAVGAVVFGSDQGLVGRFNESLLEFVVHSLGALPGKTRRIWAVGERMRALVADGGLPCPSLLSVPDSVGAITPLIGQLLIEIEAARERGEVFEVVVFHNHPKSDAIYEPIVRRLLPLDGAWQRRLAALPWPTRNLPQVQGALEAALKTFVREYLFVLLFQACAESLSSENASRLAAMQRADKNIQDILADLSRQFHRIRQESIDEELFEVISGFEASGTGRRHPPNRVVHRTDRGAPGL